MDKTEHTPNNSQTDNSSLSTISIRACQFAEWLQKNRWFSFNDEKWNYTFEHGTSITEASYNKNYRKTTRELYSKFCQEKGY